MNRMTSLLPLLLVIVGASAAEAATPDFAGTWNITLDSGTERKSLVLELKESDHKYTGTSTSFDSGLRLTYEGDFDGKRLRLVASVEGIAKLIAAPPTAGFLDLNLKQDKLIGRGTLFNVSMTLVGARPVEKSGSATTHDFSPSRYLLTLSARHEPVLHIKPGDSVRTTTVDANGLDGHREWASMPGNPHTGPFYIEGAMPGDTLAVHLSRVRANSDRAEMACGRIGPSAVAPTAIEKWDDDCDWIWTLDDKAGTAKPANPSSRLRNLQVPLRPMIGSIGVAPPDDEAISTADLRTHGGNLDYNRLTEGTTIYLPVFQPGALFSLGDGHAAQGAGEVTGQGLETSLAVEFRVDVIKGKALRFPWAEDDDYVMFSGIGGSLNEALQAATTGLVQWLEDRYQLNTGDVAMLLGTSLEYDVAEVVDPRPHMVAKLKKSVLAQITSP